MRSHLWLCLALGVAAAACGKPAPKAVQANRPNFLSDVPYISKSLLVDTTGTADAQHVVLLSPGPIDSVAAFYRTRLPPMGWRLLSDIADSIHVSLYLERNGQPMWIQMEAQGPQTRLSFTAAGGAAAPPPAGQPQR